MRLYPDVIKRNYFLLLALIVFIIARCEDEDPVPRDYPRVRGTEVANISDSGATFTADLYSLGNEILIEYGFVWGIQEGLDYYLSDKVIIGKPDHAGVFNAEIRSSLKLDDSYYVRPFVTTETRIVYGPPAIFKSMGSNPPVIKGFSPDSAGWGDTVRIIGSNFSYIPNANVVKLNEVNCRTIKSTDTTLFFIVNPSLKDIKNVISVDLKGIINLFTKDTLKLIKPGIKDIQPRQASWGDTLSITGSHLKYVSNVTPNYVKLGSFICSLVGSLTDSLIKIRVPYELTTIPNSVSISTNGLVCNFPDTVTLLAPYFSFSPEAGTFGNTIILSGRFNTIASRNRVYFNNIQTIINSVTTTTMLIKVPTTLSDNKSIIKYTVAPFNVSSVDSFKLMPPIIKSFSPMYGPSGTMVTIRGSYFSQVASFSVKFGTINSTVSSINDSVIVVKVPPGISGLARISVNANSLSGTSDEEFQVTIPRITGVYPLNGTFNDEVTITGENFIPNTTETSVKIGTYAVTILSISESKITFSVPTSLDSIPRPVTVRTADIYVNSTESFSLIPHQIISISPDVLNLGGDVRILGEGFNPDPTKTIIRWSQNNLIIKNISKNEILASIPLAIPGGKSRIEVLSGGYIRRSDQFFEIRSQWMKILPPSWFSWNSGVEVFGPGIGLSAKGIGYMMDFYSAQLTSFNPLTNEFKSLGAFPRFSQKYEPTYVVNNDTLFIVGESLGVNWYNIETNSWEYFGPAPMMYESGIAFSINGKLYYGLTYDGTSITVIKKELWALENGVWVRKKDFPGNSRGNAECYFTIGDKGYVICGDNKFWEYDSNEDSWRELPSFPGVGTNRKARTSFVINNKAYSGLGRVLSGGKICDDIWIFDSETENWQQGPALAGGGRYYGISYVIDGKAYIGFGRNTSHITVNYILEFDPNYPSK